MDKDLALRTKNNFDRVKTVGILGWGISGQGAAYLAGRKLGRRVIISESRRQLSPAAARLARLWGAEVELGGHSRNFLAKADLWVVSPAVKPDAEAFSHLRRLGIPWVGEIEFAGWFCPAPVLAVTGSNGKTTTAALLSHLLSRAGRRHYLGGNIGSSFARASLELAPSDWVVLEVSSFQLAYTFTFAPFISCLLNFYPNHLDWHRSLEDYFLAKKRIFANQKETGYALFAASLEKRLGNIKARKLPLKTEGDSADFVRAVASLLGIAPSLVTEALSSFKALPHRLEFVRNVRGINFINDSKSTNVEAAIWALQKIEGKIVLIAGGQDKGLDYSRLNPYLGKVKKVFLTGPARHKIASALAGGVDWEYKETLRDAVSAAYHTAEKGESVLLSPMCSSFDAYANFEERGNAFKEEVYKLPV